MIPASLGQTAPDHLYIELTNRCNLRCKHCYLSAGPVGQEGSIRRWCTGPFRNSPLWPDAA